MTGSASMTDGLTAAAAPNEGHKVDPSRIHVLLVGADLEYYGFEFNHICERFGLNPETQLHEVANMRGILSVLATGVITPDVYLVVVIPCSGGVSATRITLATYFQNPEICARGVQKVRVWFDLSPDTAAAATERRQLSSVEGITLSSDLQFQVLVGHAIQEALQT